MLGERETLGQAGTVVLQGVTRELMYVCGDFPPHVLQVRSRVACLMVALEILTADLARSVFILSEC